MKSVRNPSSFSTTTVKGNASLLWFISEFNLTATETEYNYTKLKALVVEAGFDTKTTEANRVANWILFGGSMPAILEQYIQQSGTQNVVSA